MTWPTTASRGRRRTSTSEANRWPDRNGSRLTSDEPNREQMISNRYRQRRGAGEPGWTGEESYCAKKKRLTDFLDRHQVSAGGRCLELGCGAGNLTLEMARRGFNAHGIDLSTEAIAWARTNAAESALPATFQVGSVVTLDPYGDACFDVVFDGDCLWMVVGSERPRCFSSIFRVLRPGGILFAEAHLVDEGFDQPCEMAPNACFDPKTRCSTIDGVPMYHYSTESGFRDELRRAGFEIVHADRTLTEDPSDDSPFMLGDTYVDARKPAEDGQQLRPPDADKPGG